MTPGPGPVPGAGVAADAAAGPSPAGWYPGPWGWQWWDGLAWGPVAAPPTSHTNDTTLAMLAHLSAFLGGVILSGVLYAISQDKPFVRDHAREALNAQITFLIVGFVPFFVGMFGALPLMAASGGSATTGVGVVVLLVLGFGLFMVAWVLHIVWAITGAIRANRGEAYRYPLILRLVKA